MKHKKKDLYMLAHLREDSRVPLTTLSRRTHIPVSTLFDRLRSEENSGLFRKRTVIPDFSELGFGTRIIAAIKVPKDVKEDLREYLERNLNLNSMFQINNGYNFLIDCLFRNMAEVEEFKDEVESRFQISQMDIHFILDELKVESFLDSSSKVDALLGGGECVECAE